jgi:hypothetical protein
VIFEFSEVSEFTIIRNSTKAHTVRTLPACGPQPITSTGTDCHPARPSSTGTNEPASGGRRRSRVPHSQRHVTCRMRRRNDDESTRQPPRPAPSPPLFSLPLPPRRGGQRERSALCFSNAGEIPCAGAAQIAGTLQIRNLPSGEAHSASEHRRWP